MVVLHGNAGYLDEAIIAVVAFAVLWAAIKLAKQKPADQDDDAVSEPRLTEDEALPPVSRS